MLAFLFDWSGRSGRRVFALTVTLVLIVSGVLLYGPLAQRMPQDPLNRGMAVAFGVVFLPYHAVVVRRLHDTGRSGWWLWVSLVPVLGQLVLWAMCMRPPRDGYTPRPYLPRRIGVVATTVLAGLLISRAAWLPVWAPAASMKPAIMPGDLVLVGFTAPADFTRGDMVAFRHPDSGAIEVKRLIGLPGDRVQMQDGRLVLNGAPVPVDPAGTHVETFEPQGPAGSIPQCANGLVGMGGTCEKPVLRETLAGRSYDTLDIRMGPLDNMPMVALPPGHVFVLGDNRDNSIDSRVPPTARGIGLVPEDRLIGRAGRVMISAGGRWMLDVRNWRGDRFLKRIE